jgi:outer membrane protein OmpA-like peptidoglycan-associated protein
VPAKGKGKAAPKGTGGSHVQAETTPGETGVLDLQRWAGNRSVASMLTLSRQPAPPDVKAPGPPTDPVFDKKVFGESNPRFQLVYTPNGPMPVKGDAVYTLRVQIDFKDFTRADMRKEPFRTHRFTRAQIADFKWTEAEKTKFGADFQSQVSTAWSKKHELVTKDPTFAEHRAQVEVKVELVEKDAHNTMTALKVPKGKAGEKEPPGFRSFVSGDGKTSSLDSRDVSDADKETVRDRPLLEQVGGFANNSSELTPDIKSAIEGVAATIKRKGFALGERLGSDGKKHDLAIFTIGRTTSKGSRSRNTKLGQDRAKAVLDHLNATIGWGDQGKPLSSGEKNTTEEEQFRRVDVVIIDLGEGGSREVTQNTAAHEAGHMFGLDDEYVEEVPDKNVARKFWGDKPEHFGDVEAQLGTDAAKELVMNDSGNIMSVGSDVKRGHYVPFLKSIEAATSKDWTVA